MRQKKLTILTQNQIRKIKVIRSDQIAEIENHKTEIILDPIRLVQIKKTPITKIKAKEDLNQSLKIMKLKIHKVKTLLEENQKKIKKI